MDRLPACPGKVSKKKEIENKFKITAKEKEDSKKTDQVTIFVSKAAEKKKQISTGEEEQDSECLS